MIQRLSQLSYSFVPMLLDIRRRNATEIRHFYICVCAVHVMCVSFRVSVRLSVCMSFIAT